MLKLTRLLYPKTFVELTFLSSMISKKDLKESNAWFKDVIEIIKTAGGPRELMEHSRIEMYSDNVFCFTPKGDVISMIKGSSALDFAYAIHSTLGEKTSFSFSIKKNTVKKTA